MINLPRIRARVGQGDDKKFYFEISMWNFTGTEMIGGEPVGTFGPWKDEKEAHEKMNEAVELACKAATNGEANGFVDFKNNGEFRPFKSSDN